MSDPAGWIRIPILAAAVKRWWSARGQSEPGDFKLPFSCDWEDLLTQAGLTSAEHRREADRDARKLDRSELIKLKLVKYRPYEIERLVIPLAAESRLRELFTDELPVRNKEVDLSAISWQPELSFLMGVRTSVPLEDLLKLNQFFEAGGRHRKSIPIKERSLEIFGDEKRLDALRTTVLFKSDQLSLKLLNCFTVPLPFGWRRGPNPQGPILVLENAATWDSYCRWNEQVKLYSSIVFGNGYQFSDSIESIKIIFDELSEARPIVYFGDIDPTGVWIPQRASIWMVKNGFPPISADLKSYRWLVELGAGKATPMKETAETGEVIDLSWLDSLADPVAALFASHKRLPQEFVTWDFLHQQIKK